MPASPPAGGVTGLLQGKKLSDAGTLAERLTAMMHGDEKAAKDRSLGDRRALQSVSKFPVRIKCVLLAFDALTEALEETGVEAPDVSIEDVEAEGG